MKHWSFVIMGFVLAIFLFGTNALTQQERGDQHTSPQAAEPRQHGYVNGRSVHKLMIGSEDIGVYNNLASSGAWPR